MEGKVNRRVIRHSLTTAARHSITSEGNTPFSRISWKLYAFNLFLQIYLTSDGLFWYSRSEHRIPCICREESNAWLDRNRRSHPVHCPDQCLSSISIPQTQFLHPHTGADDVRTCSKGQPKYAQFRAPDLYGERGRQDHGCQDYVIWEEDDASKSLCRNLICSVLILLFSCIRLKLSARIQPCRRLSSGHLKNTTSYIWNWEEG